MLVLVFACIIKEVMDTLFSIGSVPISTFGVFAGASFVVFSFVLWQRLKEDFEEEAILTFTIFLALSFLLGARVFYILTHFSQFGFSFAFLLWRVYPGFSLLGGVLSAIGFTYWWTKKKQWVFWEIGDSILVSFSFSSFVIGLGLFASKLTKGSLYSFIFSFLFLAIVFFLYRNYRKFIWYESGKPGFVSSLGLGLFSLGVLILEFIRENGVSYSWESLGFFWLVLSGFSFLYYRSERSFRDDLKKTRELMKKPAFRKRKNG